jgi:hypothetical protein
MGPKRSVVVRCAIDARKIAGEGASLDQAQALLVLVAQSELALVHVVEGAELHCGTYINCCAGNDALMAP